MPSGSRIRSNNVFGVISDNPLTVGATSFNSTSLFLLPAVSSAHAIVVLDPKRVNGEPEIVIVTAHTALATVATITRGAYGTTARAHPLNSAWANVAVIDDMIPVVTSSTRPSDPYRGQMIFETDTNLFVARDTSDAWQTAVPLGAWVSYTPTLTQGGAVTMTVVYAKFNRIGRQITGNVRLNVTGTGTAATAVKIGIPVTAAVGSNLPVGTGHIFDISVSLSYKGVAVLETTTTIWLRPTVSNSPNLLGAVDFTAALASGDEVDCHFTYEAAS